MELLDRDHSILAFNQRVLSWAEREDVPLLERLRYLCIVSSNLDEWFEVRSAPMCRRPMPATTRLYTRRSFETLMATAHALVAHQYHLYNHSIIPAFAKHAIRLVSHGERNATQRKWVREFFCARCSLCSCPWGWIRRTRFLRWPTRR